MVFFFVYDSVLEPYMVILHSFLSYPIEYILQKDKSQQTVMVHSHVEQEIKQFKLEMHCLGSKERYELSDKLCIGYSHYIFYSFHFNNDCIFHF